MLSQTGNVDAHDPPLSSATSEYTTLAGLSDPTTFTDPDADGSHVNKTPAHEELGAQTPHPSPAVLSDVRRQGDNKTVSPSMIQLPRHQVEALKAAAALVLRASQKLLPARQAAILLRNELDYERETSKYTRQYFEQSSRKLVEFAAAREASDRLRDVQPPAQFTIAQDSPTIEDVSKVQELFVSDNRAVDEQDEKIRKLQDDLSNKEFSMQSREKKLADATRELVAILQKSELAGSEGFDLDLASEAVTKEPSISIRAPSPEVHPTLQLYYEKAGTAQVLRERLVELDFEHREAMTLRVLQRDQELWVEPPDEDFHRAHQETRSALLQDYEGYLRAASKARDECVDQGIDPDEYRRDVNSAIDVYPEELYLNVPTLAAEEVPITPDQGTDAVEDFYMSDKVLSSAMLTGITGNLDYEMQQRLSLQQTPNIAQVNKRVRDWIQSSEIEGESKEVDGQDMLLLDNTAQDSSLTNFHGTLQDDDVAAIPTLVVEDAPSEGRGVVLARQHRPLAALAAEEVQNDERNSSRTLGVCAEPSEEVRQDSPLSQPMPP